MTAITPEQFMTQTEPDEEEFQREHLAEWSSDPLESIAASLRRLVARGDKQAAEEEWVSELREAYDDLEAKHTELYALLQEIEAIIRPSTSKLANSVRDAITAWRAPEVSVEGLDEPPVEGAGDHPSHDAPVEEWREYARTVHGVDEGTVLDTMNRSQIRSALGIDQPA